MSNYKLDEKSGEGFGSDLKVAWTFRNDDGNKYRCENVDLFKHATVNRYNQMPSNQLSFI